MELTFPWKLQSGVVIEVFALMLGDLVSIEPRLPLSDSPEIISQAALEYYGMCAQARTVFEERTRDLLEQREAAGISGDREAS